MAELMTSPGKKGAKRAKRMPLRIDLTAMVDLAFLLITFFMLTTSLAKPREMPVVMPADGPAGPVPESRTMTICLGKNNQVMYYLGLENKPLIAPTVINGSGVRAAIIETAKQVQAKTGHGLIVIVKPAEHSIYNNLVDAFDELDIAKVPTYAIAALTPKDVDLLKQKGIF
jgi:biopolymer transport protein ExbD